MCMAAGCMCICMYIMHVYYVCIQHMYINSNPQIVCICMYDSCPICHRLTCSAHGQFLPSLPTPHLPKDEYFQM